MSTEELKKEIQKAIETVPDSVLNEIYNYIRQIKEVDSDKLTLAHNLNRILNEDKELLNKLSN